MAMLLFYIGKGGVGKSTLSALTAVSAAAAGRRTLLLSLDPAHNLSDIFGMPLNDSDTTLLPGLDVREVDVRAWMQRYLREVEQDMRRNYTYLTALNLDKYFRLLRHSPGMEEFALSLAFREMLQSHEKTDLIVCDMPPTALALRFFAAPSISLSWTDELTSLRRLMLEKKQIASKIRFGSREIARDRVLQRLEEDARRHRETQRLFGDPERTRLRIVCNDDELSLREAERIHEELFALGMHTDMLLQNKCKATTALPESIAGLSTHVIPPSGVPLHGLPILREHAAKLSGILPEH